MYRKLATRNKKYFARNAAHLRMGFASFLDAVVRFKALLSFLYHIFKSNPGGQIYHILHFVFLRQVK